MTYLKVHYPNYFYANILSNVIGNETKTAIIIEEAKTQSLNILPQILIKVTGFTKRQKKYLFIVGCNKRCGISKRQIYSRRTI